MYLAGPWKSASQTLVPPLPGAVQKQHEWPPFVGARVVALGQEEEVVGMPGDALLEGVRALRFVLRLVLGKERHAHAEAGYDEASYDSRLHLSLTFQIHANCSFVIAASASQPREGVLLIEETSLIEICRPRVFGPLTSTSAGLQVCWLIFWYGAGL